MHEVDVTNSNLRKMENITVLESPYDIYDIFRLERPFEDIVKKLWKYRKKQRNKFILSSKIKKNKK